MVFGTSLKYYGLYFLYSGFDVGFTEETNDYGRGNTHIVYVSVNRWQQSLFSLVVLVTKIHYFRKELEFSSEV